MLASVHLLAGLSWDPAIKGILVVTLGVAILMGSIYLIVGTNTGARLGLMIVLGSLFGFLSILTLYWWISPPGIGPRGQDPSWKPVEVFVNDSNYTTVVDQNGSRPARTAVVDQLPTPVNIPTAAEVLEQNPELAAEFPQDPATLSLSDLAGTADGVRILRDKYGLIVSNEEVKGAANSAGGWKLMTTSQAGEAGSAADQALKDAGLFQDATEYKKLDAFEIGGNPKRGEECADDDQVCRAIFRIQKTFRLWHPPHFAVIQVQPVVKQETVPGEAPPTPVVDESQPVISVVLIRDQGNVRAKPAYFFAICFSLFLVFVLLLHYRDKTLRKNLDEAEQAKAEAKAKAKA